MSRVWGAFETGKRENEIKKGGGEEKDDKDEGTERTEGVRSEV
jgi:hypothetical protein